MISNCLFEAIKAKIKDPKNVTIHHFPASINGNGIWPHFWWSIGETGYDFKKESETKQNILFSGKIRSYEKRVYEDRIKLEYKRALQKKYLKKGINLFDDCTWHCTEVNIEAKYYYVSYINEEGKIKVAFVKKEDLGKYDIFNWMPGDDNESQSLLFNGEVE